LILSYLVGLLHLAAPAWSEEVSGEESASIEFFEKHVRPIFVARCVECHGPDQQKGGLRLDHTAGILKGGDQGAPFIPSKPGESLLIEAISYQVEGFQMPPQGKISDDEIRLLTEWVRGGAHLPKGGAGAPTTASATRFSIEDRKDHWAYQPVKQHPLPIMKSNDKLQSPIDTFIEKLHDDKHLTGAPRAERLALLRRITFDLTGIPPALDDIDEFMSDTRPDAYERRIDLLLASPRYGERWGRHWLDLVRYAETLGHEFDFELPEAWHYRDYVIRALNRDLPYDLFVKEHIAGDLLTPQRIDPTSGRKESGIAPAFFWFGEASHSPVDVRQAQADRIDNQIDVLSKTFLAQSVSCARCHDHKFDAISQKDYYALAGFLKSSRYDQRPVGNDEQQHRRLVDLQGAEIEADQIARQMMMPSWESQTHRLSHRLQEKSIAPKDLSAENPFYVAKILNDDPTTAIGPSFSARAALVRAKLAEQARKAAESREVTFATFSPEERTRWKREGDAFRDDGIPRPHFVPMIKRDKGGVRFIDSGWSDSSAVAKELEGTLRSETFLIERNFIHVNAAGRGTRVNVIIDGFPIIRDPIYGGLTIRLNDDHPSWRTFNVSKWVGHRAYIEFVDQSIADLSHGPGEGTPSDGYFSAREIVFSSQSNTPTPAGHPLNLEVLQDPIPKSSTELMSRYQEAIRKAFEIVRDSSLPVTAEAVRAYQLVKALLDTKLFDSETPESLSSETIERIVDVTRKIEQLQKSWERPIYAPSFAEGTGEDEFVFIRGNHKTLAAVAPRRFLEVIDGPDSLPINEGSGRRELSERFTSSKNPLLSRVWANRIWKHHFAEGIVRSPDDFGKMGQPPSHPELLDWLAAELIESDWSTKHLHRVMLTSSTYQMGSSVPKDVREQDPRNEYLTRMPLRRLEAEAVRDSLLVVSGRFDSKMEGPGVDPYLTDFMPPIGRPPSSGPIDGAGRRSVYLKVRRNFLSPLLLAFDYPLPQTTIGRRNTSNVPAQALSMLNDQFILDQCHHWATHLVNDVPTIEERIARAYLEAFGRPVRTDEMDRLKAFIDLEGTISDRDQEIRVWTTVCHSLVNAKEFIFIP
jgi:cytochrome c553